MDRISVKDVEGVFKVYVDVFDSYGLVRDGFRLVLEQGSATYGRAWRVYETAIGGGGGLSRPLVGSDYLGMTARQAYDCLHDRLSVVHGMADVRTAGTGDV